MNNTNSVSRGRIMLDDMADLYFAMDDVKTIDHNNHILHLGIHLDLGQMAISQWAGDDYATLSIKDEYLINGRSDKVAKDIVRRYIDENSVIDLNLVRSIIKPDDNGCSI